MAIKLNYSSELMTNYIHASVVSPLNNFIALQTADGHSLLFAMGTNNRFHVLTEDSGTTNTGWKEIDLSNQYIQTNYPGTSSAQCKTFSAAQSAVDNSISLAMTISNGSAENDVLCLCLNNSHTDNSWLNNPSWTAFPYDNPQSPSCFKGTLIIEKIFFTETIGGNQYIVVDVLEDSTSPIKNILRFIVDPSKANGYAWTPYHLSINIEAENYSTCIGQISANAPIDGVYTMGKAGTINQIEFRPVINYWGTGPINPTLLYLPSGIMGDSMASVRITDPGSSFVNNTELYVTANNGLYFFSAQAQANAGTANPCTGQLVVSSDLLHNVTKLFAYKFNNTTYVCGLNNADQVFFMTCPSGSEGVAGSWSLPLPIVSQVDLLSPYVNLVDGGKTLFAVDNGGFYKLVQSPQTTLWSKQHMLLPAPEPTAPALKFSSYTTHISITDENNQPLRNYAINLSAATRTAFYINNLYYIIDTQPVSISTDTMGVLNIVESVQKLNGTTLTLTDKSGTTIKINPMDKPMGKLAVVNDSDKVKNAMVTDQQGNKKPLIGAGATSEQLNAIAQANTNLGNAYTSVTNPAAHAARRANLRMAVPAPFNIGNTISTAIGDLFRFIEHEADIVINIVEDVANDVYHFVVKIGDAIYSAILNCAETIAAAVEYVYNAVKTAIEEVIAFLKFLFELDDLKRTKEVVKNIGNLFVKQQITNIKNSKASFDSFITDLEAKFNSLINGQPDLASVGSSNVNTMSNPSQHQSAPGNLISNHYRSNAGNSTVISQPASTVIANPDNVIDVLTNLINTEEQVVTDKIEKIINVLQNANNMTVVDMVKQLLTILADFVFETVKTVVDALFDVLIIVVELIYDILNTVIHIPVVSDILADFGVKMPSIMDILSWMVAIPSTLIYKAIFNEAPFPDNATTQKYINAQSFDDLKPSTAAIAREAIHTVVTERADSPSGTAARTARTAAVKPVKPRSATVMASESVATATPAASSNAAPVASNATATAPGPEEARAFKAYHIISALCSFENAYLMSMDATDPDQANEFGKGSAIFAVIGGGTWGLAGLINPQYPVEDKGWDIASKVFLGLRIGNLVLTSGKVPKIPQSRKYGAIIDSIIGIANLIFTIEHFVELGKKPADNQRTLAILDETSMILSYVARWGYTARVCSKNPYVQVGGEIGIVAGCLGYGGLQIAEAAAYNR